MRPTRAERRPLPPQRFASCLYGATRNAARNRVGIDDVQPTQPRGTRQCGLATTVRAGHDMERGHDWKRCPAGSGGLPVGPRDYPVSVLRPRDVGAIRPDAVKRRSGLDLTREVGLDLLAPILWTTGLFRRRRCFLVLPHAADLTSDVRGIQSAIAGRRRW